MEKGVLMDAADASIASDGNISKDDFLFADGTLHQTGCGAEIGVHLEDGFDPLVKARLTQVVKNLRGDWIAHVATHWGDIHPIGVHAVGDFDKRIAAALSEGFLCFSQFLCCFELFLLESEKLGIVTEESVLRLEKFIIEFCNNRCNLVEVPYRQ